MDELSEDDLIGTLEKGEQRIQTLREQKQELMKANKQLVKLVKELEDRLEDKGHQVELEGYDYSYQDGWKQSEDVKRESMEIEEADEDEISSQIREVVRSLKQLDSFK